MRGKGVTAYSRPEYIGDINLAYNTESVLGGNGLLPNDMFLYGLLLQVEGRLTNAGANNPTGRLVHGVLGLIDRIQVEGYHLPRATKETFISISGADLFNLQGARMGRNPYLSHAQNSTDLVITASATNDFRFNLLVPFTPLGMNIRQQASFLLDAPNYRDLTIKIKTADDKSVFSGQTSASTLSAFGSASGSARVRVTRLAALAGASKFAGFVPSRVWLTSSEVSSGDIVNGGTQKRLHVAPRGYRLRGALIKAGTKATVTSGNNAYATLSDSILSDIRFNRGLDKSIFRVPDMFSAREAQAMYTGFPSMLGYAMLDFAPHGDPTTALDTAALIAGATGDVETYISADIAGGANQVSGVVWEEWRGVPTQVSL